MSLEFVSTMSLEFIVNYVLDWFTHIAASQHQLLAGDVGVFISIDEWNQFARSLHIHPVGVSEFLGKHFLLHPDSVEEDRDQK